MLFEFEREEYLYIEGIFYSDYLKLIKNLDQNTVNLVRREIDKIDKYSLKVLGEEKILVTFFFGNVEDSINVMKILNGLIAFLKIQAFNNKSLLEKVEKIKIERDQSIINIDLQLDKKNEKILIENLIRMFSENKTKSN